MVEGLLGGEARRRDGRGVGSMTAPSSMRVRDSEPRSPYPTGTTPPWPAPVAELERELTERESPMLRDAVIAEFLGTWHGTAHEYEVGKLAAALYFSCLDAFATEGDRTLVATVGFTYDGESIQQPRFIRYGEPNADLLRLPLNVAYFVEAGGVRFVIEGGRRDFATHAEIRISSNGDADALFQAWQRFTRTGHTLRGKAFLWTGEAVSVPADLSWDDVYIPEAIKDQIRRQVAFLHDNSAALRTDLGVRQRRGLILSGPPGTGKTLIGRILAATTGSTMLWITPGIFERGAEPVQAVCELARLLAPCILFLEDIDSSAEDRAYSADGARLGELMNQLDGAWGDHPIVAIATTNRPAMVEVALRNRPGRFDRVIEIPPPTAANRQAYFTRRFGGQVIAPADLDWLCAQTDGHTGAEVEECANTILVAALEQRASEAAPLALDRAVMESALREQGREPAGGIGFGTGPK